MKILCVLFLLIAIPFNVFSLTLDEATLYGSRILVCKGKEVKYWTLTQIHNKRDNSVEHRIHDTIKHRSYSLNECRLYKCSPEPDRMYKCKMSDK